MSRVRSFYIKYQSLPYGAAEVLRQLLYEGSLGEDQIRKTAVVTDPAAALQELHVVGLIAQRSDRR